VPDFLNCNLILFFVILR